MKRQPAEKWRVEETDKFYLALQIFGTDFSMIEKVFQGERSREQIKNKFRKEERKNKQFIDGLLANKEGLTLKDFKARFGPIKIAEKKDKPSALKDEKESEGAHEGDSGSETSSLGDMLSDEDSDDSDVKDDGESGSELDDDS